MLALPFQDNHLHSSFSDGTFSLKDIFGYNHFHDALDIIIADHVDKNTRWFQKYIKEIKKLRKQYKDFSVKAGCEVKIIDEQGELNATKDILKSAEVVIGSVHHFKNIKSMSEKELLKKEFELTKILAQNTIIDILGHPFSMCKRFYKSNPPPSYIEEVYRLCVKNKIKFEYNKKNSPENVKKFVYREISRGNINNFSFGSDMHDNLSEIGESAFDVAPRLNILITGAGTGIGQSIIKSVKLSQLKTHIVPVDNSFMAAGLYAGDSSYLIPMKHEKNYVSEIIRICNKEKINYIFVGTDVELEILSKNKKTIESKTSARLIISNTKSIQIADDKWKTVEFLKKHSFPYAKSFLKKDLEKALREISFPMVVKPRVGARSVGFSIIRDEKELRQKVNEIKSPIIQEYLSQDDEEYTCGAFFFKGKNYGVITAKRWLRSGDTYKAIFHKDKRLEEFIARVGNKLKIYGPCNFQLRKTKRGPVIFEINCRFSGTSGAASLLGFNPANAIMQSLSFLRPLKKLTFRKSYMFRYWNEIFSPEQEVKKLKIKKYIQAPFSEKNIF